MLRILFAILFFFSGIISIDAWAEEALSTTSNSSPIDRQIIELTPGKTLSYDQIAAITDIQSARNQSGKSVTLDKSVNYTVGSYTRATLSLVPPGGELETEITLDLSSQQ